MTKLVVQIMIRKGHRDLAAMRRNTKGARKKNEKLLFKILEANKSCEYGRKYHFDQIKTVDDFRKMVPLSVYADYEEYIDRMTKESEENLITSLPLVGYAQSSGTVGNRKFVPLTQPDIEIYKKYSVTRLLALADEYSRRRFNKPLDPFRGMFTGPAYDDYLPNGMLCSNVPDVTAKQLGYLYPYFLNVPFKKLFNTRQADYRYVNFRFALADRDTLFILGVFFKDIADLIIYLEKNWTTLVEDIEKGTVSELSRATPETKEKLKKVIKPDPERAAELRREFEKGFDKTIIKRIWPNLSVISGIGTATFEPFCKMAREYTAGIPFDFAYYGASEGLFAVSAELESMDQLLLTDSCYYEFIPEDDENTILSLDELEQGKRYEIVITNQAGLYRYRSGDVISVEGYLNDCPYLQFAYRKGQLLNLTGEKTTEAHMRSAIKVMEDAADCNVGQWAVYNNVEDHPFHYVLLTENDAGADLRKYAADADRALREINPRYAYFTDMHKINPITIENLKPGTNREWMDRMVARGTSHNQVKPVRVLDTGEKEEFFLSRITKQNR